MDYRLMHKYLTYWTYTLLWIGLYVSGQMTIKQKLWRNKNVCIDDITSLNKDKTADNLCTTILNKTEKSKTQNVDGRFNADISQLTNLTLNLSAECPDSDNISSCSAIEGNESCFPTTLFCLYIAQHEAEAGEAYFTRWPIEFGTKQIDKIRMCSPHIPVTFHHSIYAYQELLSCISTNPNIFFWTDSYITSRNDDELQKLLVTERTNSSKTTLKTCIRYCLNVRGNPKVSIIAYNSTEETCACFAKGDYGSRMPLFGGIFEIRDSDDSPDHIEHINQLKGNTSCIAAIYRNATIKFHVKNCSFSYSILCGPNRCTKQETSKKCDYSRNTIRSVTRRYKGRYRHRDAYSSTSRDRFPHTTHIQETTLKSSANVWKISEMQDETTPSSNPPEKTENPGLSTEHTILIVILSIVFMGISIALIAYFKKKCSKNTKRMERERPNSTSNRTYLMQNTVAPDDEDLYTSISDFHIIKPLLPPRNNVNKPGEVEVTFKTEYSTPSDTVVAVAELDVYTDTYDSPFRRSNCVGGILKDSTGDAAKMDSVNKDTDDDGGYECCSNATCALDVEEKVVHFQRTCPSKSTTHEPIDDINPVSRTQDQGDYEHCCQTLTGDDQLNQSTNNYFLLAKCEGSLDPKTESLQDISGETEDPANEADSSDYEDTSVVDGSIGLKSLNKACTSTEHNYSNDPNKSSEKSLLCTISPFLLKQLNIKIVPDDNDYAMNYLKGPKSSSDERMSISDLPDSGVTHCSCNNPQDKASNQRGANTADMGQEYDKLCYVRRVVSAGKPHARNAYYHAVLKQEDSSEKIVLRRSSV